MRYGWSLNMVRTLFASGLIVLFSMGIVPGANAGQSDDTILELSLEDLLDIDPDIAGTDVLRFAALDILRPLAANLFVIAA